MAFIQPMHRNKPNITYLLTGETGIVVERQRRIWRNDSFRPELAPRNSFSTLLWSKYELSLGLPALECPKYAYNQWH